VATSSSPAGGTSERLEARDELERELVAMVAHELRDPMTSTIGFAEMLLRRGDRMTEAERREALETIAKSGRRLVHILDELMDATRLESGAIPLVMQPVDMNEIVGAVIEEQKGTGPSNIEVERTEDTACEADRDRVHQVIANLVSNAVKFSGSEALVRVSVRREAHEVVVAVQDRGIGIAPDDVPKLFGRFVRIPSSGGTDGVPGTGLGLYISKRIVDAHRGRIWVQAAPGKGSTFFVAFPVSQRSA
jgi:signal transduction histidine kinase